jgi:hypothetical protein
VRPSPLLCFLLAAATWLPASAAPLLLSRSGAEVSLTPSSLEAWYKGPRGPSRLLSRGLGTDADPGASVVLRGPSEATIILPRISTEVRVSFDGAELGLEIVRSAPGSLAWPSLPLSEARYLIWPLADGRYIPVADPAWMKDLTDEGAHELGSGLPVWGWVNDRGTVAWATETPYRSSLVVSKETLALRQEFLCRRGAEAHRFSVRVSDRVEPLLPAFLLRDRLRTAGLFRTISEKLAGLPAGTGERLLGALHAYLWGDRKISTRDIKPRAFPELARRLSDGSAFSRLVLARMDDDSRQAVGAFVREEYAGAYAKSGIARGLDAALATMSAQDLSAGLAGLLQPPDTWGEGGSPVFVRELESVGIDRARLTLPGVGSGELYTATARAAAESGFLFGVYDSYHSIHPQSLWGTDQSWETAQITQELFDSGSIRKADGTFYTGYQGKGRLLNPIAAQPSFVERVSRNLSRAPLSFYFVDADAAGEIYEDYNPLHPSTAEEIAAARRLRLGWLARERGLVVGSEGGDALIAPAILISEGLFGPVFSWEEPEYRDRASSFYQGSYWPPEAPAIQFQAMTLKPDSVRRYFDPTTRIPLFEAAFHDSLIITNHWGADPLKFAGMERRAELFQLLYLAAPLYNLNRDRLAERGGRILANYRFFSPLHRVFGNAGMTAFDWLDTNRMVQRTTFEGGLELIANFSERAYRSGGLTIAPGGIVARLPDGSVREYRPG